MSDHKEVLVWVNQVREQYDIGAPLVALPLGVRRWACQCPVARALVYGTSCLGAMVNSGLATVSDPTGVEEFAEVLPSEVRAFVEQFDGGYFPELDEASH